MSGDDTHVDGCPCCEGVRALTPAAHANRSGLTALAYRVGTHGSFKATMLARLSGLPALGALTTRSDDDPTIALIDAWATVADVLSFYIERTANEGFVRTATEPRSIQELAHSIGYQTRPGVAASAHLAFIVEDGPGAAEKVPIPMGTRAQSRPDGDQLPQTFETTAELIAHPEWNALRPRQTEQQLVTTATRVLYFAGTDTRLSRGDWMVLRAAEDVDPAHPGAVRNIPLQVLTVEADQERQHTRVELVRPQVPTTPLQPLPVVVTINPPPPSTFVGPIVLSGANAAALASQFTWSSEDTQLFAEMQFLPEAAFAKYINKAAVPPKATDTGIFAMRVQTAPFGHNAPKYTTLPMDWIVLKAVGEPLNAGDLLKPYPFNWDTAPPDVTFASNKTSYKTIYDQEDDLVLLESVLPDAQTGSWVVLKSATGAAAACRVSKAEHVSRADFALNGKVTALALQADQDQPGFDRFQLRTTSIYAASEPVPLAGRPIQTPVEGDTIELDHMLENQILPRQPVIVSGTPTDLNDIVESELAVVKETVHVAGHTRLVFEKKLQRSYRRDSVTLNANLAPATHGESHEEVVGGGDASQSFQTFELSHAPLTYLPAPVPGGAQSSLQLRVNGVLWKEAANLFGLEPDDRRYVLRRDDTGKTTVGFGDGRTGGRLPTAFGNVSARYRSGLGVAGNVGANRIALLTSQPRNVRGVTNLLPAAGGADPESTADTRRNAPDSVRTFGRIVSLPDFEAFARAFAGIAKAQASLVHVGDTNIVHVTIAGDGGALVPVDSALYRDLLAAMNDVRDLSQPLALASYQRRFFDVSAKLRVRADDEAERVLEHVTAALRDAFSFERRDLGQAVTASEVLATMQRVEGVEGVDLDALRLSHERGLQPITKALLPIKTLQKTPTRLPALRARRSGSGPVLPAEHLSIQRINLVQM